MLYIFVWNVLHIAFPVCCCDIYLKAKLTFVVSKTWSVPHSKCSVQTNNHSFCYFHTKYINCVGITQNFWLWHIKHLKAAISSTEYDKQIRGLENVKFYNNLGSTRTDVARCTREIKLRFGMAKVISNKKQTPFTSKMDLYLGKKLVNWYIWSIAFVVLRLACLGK